MEIKNIAIEEVTAAGGTYSVNLESFTDGLYLIPDSSPVTLVANIVVNFIGTPTDQQVITVGWGSFILNGNTITINGVSLTDLQAASTGGYEFIYLYGAWRHIYIISLNDTGILSGDVLEDETVTLAKLEDVTAAQIIVGDASNRPTAVAMSGDIAITNAGVTSIAAGVIVNADVNASAAIAVSKLAAMTASKVVVTDASGFLTTAASALIVNADVNASAAIAFSKMAALTASQVVTTTAGGVITTSSALSAALGGTALDTSASTGVVTVSAGTWAVGARTEMMTLLVSFEAAGGVVPSVGDFKLTMPFAGTVTSIYAYATKAIAGTDNATIVPKNNAGTTMTSGTITFTASDTRGTAYTTTPSANNTFIAGDVLTFTTAKATAGGYAQLSITFTRTT